MPQTTNGQMTTKSLLIAMAVVAIAILPVVFGGTACWPMTAWLGAFGLAIYYRSEFAVGGLLLLGMLLIFLLPAIWETQRPRRRSQCQNNMKQLALAVLNYEVTYGQFPPPYTIDDNGRPMHSWRVLILPFVEGTALYDQIDFTKPWNHPDNLRLANQMPAVFRCPTCNSAYADLTTSYVAIVGDETLWPQDVALAVKDVSDGLSNTLMLVESEAARTHWMSPHDLLYSEIVPVTNSGRTRTLDSGHSDTATAAFGDGSVRSIPSKLTAETLQALSTVAGGEIVDPYEF